MENFDEPMDVNASPGSEAGLQITDEIRTYWVQSAKWAMFFAVLFFVLLGLVALVGLFVMVSGGIAGMTAFIFILGIYGALLFFPGLYYYRFSTQLRSALNQDDNALLDEAFANLRRFYVYFGIVTIVVIALFLVFSSMFAMAFMRGNM